MRIPDIKGHRQDDDDDGLGIGLICWIRTSSDDDGDDDADGDDDGDDER